MALKKMKSSRPLALVTGASQGIGKAVALRLAKDYDLALVSRTGGEKLRSVGEACRKQGARVFATKADLTIPGNVDFLLSEILWVFRKLDVLVHCVGDYHESSLRDLKYEEWRRLFDSNLNSSFLVTRAALASLRKSSRGRVVFMGMAGISALKPRRDCAAYAAAKTALLVYARSLALEEAKYGVTVNVVSPGVIPHEGAHASTLKKSLAKKIPLGRVGKPEDVAAAVAFLISKEAEYITAADLAVTGGWQA